MATSDKPKPSQVVPLDLFPVIRQSGVLTERQLADVKAKILSGEYSSDSATLAERLVREGVLTEYQTRRFLNGKSSGLVVGRYVIQERLGSGSMGRVYKARHQMMDRFVAIKIIAPEIVTNGKVVARFQREMKLVGRLDHPNVIRAFDADQISSVLYIVMEYVSGESLANRLRRGPVAPLEMADYGAQAALGLAHAHGQGVVHRDVKPSNLLVTQDKLLKVLDLGLGILMEADSSTSFATADGIAVGTVDYMSPEQACGREVDGRSDLYSLGCSMYHLMAGKLAFPGESPIERMGKRISGKPVPIIDVRPDVPPGLVRVLDKLLATKPQDRYQTATEAADALFALTRPKPKAAPPSEVKVATKPATPVTPPPTPVPERVVVKVTPTYPRWFAPVARLAEARPTAVLAAAGLALVGSFAAGFLVAWISRPR